jgi:serine/threonine protein phosphatase PrpC
LTRPGIARDQRLREAMEDRAVAGAVRGLQVAAVFDGHGGPAVADHAVAHALQVVDQALERGLKGAELWEAVFARLDLDLPDCGSTATVMGRRGRALSVAWVGDSRAVLVTPGQVRVLAADHRITLEAERRRVLAAGAVLRPPYVVHPRTQQGLMVTRALGDRGLREVGVIATPEVTTVAVPAGPATCLLATDGLWDVVANEEAAAMCRLGTPQEAADGLVQLVGLRRGPDNVTVVVVRL